MSDIVTIIGQRIRNYRVQLKLSQEKLAELSGCHPTYIGQVERGEKNPTIESIQKIVLALHIPMSQLFEKIGEQEKRKINYPILCYDIIAAKNIPEQKQIYNLLIEIDKYKSI